MEVLGSWCVIGKPGSRSHTKVSPDFPPCTETIPVQPEQLNMAQKVHLWVSGMSLSGHHPPPPPNSNLQFGLQPQNPYRWHRDHLNDSYCGGNPPSTALCVKRSRMFGRYYPGWCHWKVEECHSQQTLGFSLWTAVDCCRDNIGLNPERNVSTESVRGRHPLRVGTLFQWKRALWRITNSG